MLMYDTRQKARDERGMASFIITLFIMMIIGLVVIGFAQLTRRDQRQSLDRQLSVQASYAAETGVNDTLRRLEENPTFTKSDCAPEPSNLPHQLPVVSSTLDSDGDVAYTCVLVDSVVDTIKVQGVDMTDNKSFVIQDQSGANIESITFTWKKAGGQYNPCVAAGYPHPENRVGGCTFPMLRADVVPFPTGGTTRANLIKNLFTVYAHPNNGGGGTAVYNSSSDKGNAKNETGSCVNNNQPDASCTITVTGLNQNRYYVRLNAIYGSPDEVEISAKIASGIPANLIGAQALIDVTGRSGDVIKRVQVRAAIGGTPTVDTSDPVPAYGLQTAGSQCKRLGIVPTGNKVYVLNVSPADSACDPFAP